MTSKRKTLCIMVSAVLIMMFGAGLAYGADIEWKIYLGSYHAAGPITTGTCTEGETFVIEASECQSIPSESDEIIDALDGVSFRIDDSPTSGHLTIDVILNVHGNSFQSAGEIGLFLNISFIGYVNGQRTDYLQFNRSPMIITIPSGGLGYLLASGNIPHEDLVCAYYQNGRFTDEDIETHDGTSHMNIKLYKLADTVGGRSDDLGIESKVQYNTWGTIKNMFR